MIRKDLGNYMRWKTIQQQGPCEGQFDGICQGPKGIDVPMRQLAHRRPKDREDAERRLMSMNQAPNKKPGHKPRLYDSLNRPHAYRHLCPTCHLHHDNHMFDEGYQEPKWVLDNKFRQLIRDRNKNKQKIKRHGGIVKSINDFVRKFDNTIDPNEPRQTRYLHNLPSRDTHIKYEDPFDPEIYIEEESDEEYVPEMHTQNTRLPIETKRYNKIMDRISPHGSQKILDKIVGKEDIPYAKSLCKSINQFVRKFDTSYLPHEGTAKYKPQNEARARINNKLGPHSMSNRKQEVNPASSPPMGFGQKTNPEEHIVPNYVPKDKTHAFKYRGRTYDASRMTPEELSDILSEMEQQI